MSDHDSFDRGESIDGHDGGEPRFSRRGFLRSGVAAGAGAFALGAAGPAAGQTEVRRGCNGASIGVGDGDGRVMTNRWSTEEAEECVFKNDDGSYGWEWERNATGACEDDCPNFPEVVIGSKPWSNPTSAAIFPERIGNVDSLDVELDVDNGAQYVGDQTGEWNLALEWWHTESRPPIGGDPKHEIMLLLEWSESHDDGQMVEAEAFEDAYGNTIDHWQEIYDRVDWESFHIFRIAANEIPSHVDLTAILDYLRDYDDQASSYPDDVWMTGIEVGNETWDHTKGKTTVHDLDVRLDGRTATTGVDDQFDEPDDLTPPSPPANVATYSRGPDSAAVEWDRATDEGGSGVVEYVATLGSRTVTTGTETLYAEFDGLSPGTSYDVSVVAVDAAGNESEPATHTLRTVNVYSPETEGRTLTPTPEKVGSNTDGPNDPDGDGLFEDVNGNERQDIADAVDLFRNRESVDPQFFDFNESGGMSIGDAVSLFRENTG